MKMTVIITCPACGTKTEAEIPEGACLISWDCPACPAVLRPKPEDWAWPPRRSVLEPALNHA